MAFTPCIIVRTPPKRGTSLGLQTPTSFELQLLELALKGKRAFEAHWAKHGTKYDVDEEVMCYEILQEIEIWERDENVKLLQERARKLVVRMKDTNLHERAKVVYRDFLDIDRSPREDLDTNLPPVLQRYSVTLSDKVRGSTSSSQARQRESVECSSQIPDIELSIFQVPSGTDEKLDVDKWVNTELPLSNEEDSSTAPKEVTQKLEGEPSIPSTSGDVSCEVLDIFDKPAETNEGCKITRDEEDLIFRISINHELSDGESIYPIVDTMTPGSEGSYQIEGMDDNKIDLCLDENPWELAAQLGNFPAKDFQASIKWKVDKTIYKAKNLADLRSEHDVLVEGSFRKRCRTKIWRDYYGFFLATGVMIYFRREVYKKVADFRRCTVSMQNSKRYRLVVQDVYIENKKTTWPLEFSSTRHLTTWYKTIARFSKGFKNDISEALLSLDSPKD